MIINPILYSIWQAFGGNFQYSGTDRSGIDMDIIDEVLDMIAVEQSMIDLFTDRKYVTLNLKE